MNVFLRDQRLFFVFHFFFLIRAFKRRLSGGNVHFKKKQNVKSHKSCLLKVFLWCAMSELKWLLLTIGKSIWSHLTFSLLLFDVLMRRGSVTFCRTHFLCTILEIPSLEAKDSRSFLTDRILIFSRFHLLSLRVSVFFIGAHVRRFQWRRRGVSFCPPSVLIHSFFILFPGITKWAPAWFF